MKSFKELRFVIETFRKLQMRPVSFVGPSAVAFLACLSEAMAIFVLMPIIHSAVSADISHLGTYKAADLLLRFSNSRLKPMEVLVLLALMFCFFSVLKNILHYFAAVFTSMLNRTFTHRLRLSTMSTCLEYGMAFFTKNSAGTLQQILVALPQLVGHYLGHLSNIITQFFMLAMYLIALLLISWPLTLVSMTLFPLLNYGLRWLIDRIRKGTENYADSQKELGRMMFNLFSCIQLVKAYNCEAVERKRLETASDITRQHEVSLDKKMDFIPPFQESVIVIAMISIFTGVTVFLIHGEKFQEVGKLMAFFYALKKASTSFSLFNDAKASLAIISQSLQSILEAVKSEPKFIVNEGVENYKGDQFNVEFKDVTFSYDGQKKVLDHICFKCPHGEKTAIVGSSGAGKTSIANLILRFYEFKSGEIRIGSNNIRDLKFEALRAHIALISQDAQLFNDSLRNNLTYGLKSIKDVELWEALEKAELATFVSSLPQGLETKVGDRGVQLSGGERQRVSIARAFLKNPDLLILDEATSSLDMKTEKIIHKSFNKLLDGKTAIIIAHRLSTIRDVQNILFLDKGRIVEKGDFDTLISMKGYFYAQWQQQMLNSPESNNG